MAEKTQKLNLTIERTFSGPLDKYSRFFSYQEALDYASNNRTAHIGQTIAIVLKDRVEYYVIDTNYKLLLIKSSIQVPIHDQIKFDPDGNSYMTIPHNFNGYPRVTVTEVDRDEEGNIISETEVEVNVVYISKNAVRIDWVGELDGYVIINS